MADIVIYEDSPLAQYLQEIQGEHGDLHHATVPVHEPATPPEFIGIRLAHNAVDILTHLVEYLSHKFTSSSTAESEDAGFEERFKYLICTSPFLNRTVTHAHERGRRNHEVPMTIEFSYKFHPGRSGYVLGLGTLATLMVRSVLNKTRIARLPWFRPFLGRSAAAISIALASSAWMLRILALRSLQLLISHCQTLDAKVNRAIMVIQEIELVSRGYRLSTPLAPISRIEQASKTRRCNLVRAQLVAALTKSGALFQRTTETLQSRVDPERLSTLLDIVMGTDNDHLPLTASPTSELPSPLPSSFSQHIRQQSLSKRRSGTMLNGSSRPNSRPSSFHEAMNQHHPQHQHQHQHRRSASMATTTPAYMELNNAEFSAAYRKETLRGHRTSWSASEGSDSDSGTTGSPSISPRAGGTMDDLSAALLASSPEMTSLERLRKNFQRMHGHRREFLCELLSIRRRSREGRQGLMDHDRNWTVVRDVLQEGVTGIQSVVDELNKILDSELYTLPRIDTQDYKNGNSAQDKQLQPFVQRLALLAQH
ncbi:hypothetical protein BGZ65_006087, partial [Modicella reniformis]